ncbi:uncharacterized protein [Euphorbia lathyris]|uniref:uncharacterized protein n=1 Tax=Euphorbia lathyris TaxID=212925 RepID=UPI0033144D1C
MPSNPYSLLSASSSSTINSISVCLLIPNESRNGGRHLYYVPYSSSVLSHFKTSTCLAFPKQSKLSFPRFHQRGDVFSACALKKLGKGDTALLETSELDDEDDMDDEFAEENEEAEDEDEDEGMLLPLENMRKWLQNKPSGFGEGKAYDTSIEDKLLDEIEQSRKAQAANVDNLKNNPIKPKDDKKKATEVVPSGIRVRVANLPKKKNIHRDLQSIFKEVPGIINIIPAVTGNKKTKDPICKGFAFVDFKSEEHADRFVQQFSRQDVAFGRIQKRIKCLRTTSHSNSSDDESASSDPVSTLTNSNLEEDTNTSFNTGDSFSEEDTAELIPATSQDVKENAESFSMSESVNEKRTEPMTKPTSDSFSLKRDKNQAGKKKKASKVKEQKVPKLDIPGSARRLKLKEKGLLVDVFAKYGSQSTPVSAEER